MRCSGASARWERNHESSLSDELGHKSRKRLLPRVEREDERQTGLAAHYSRRSKAFYRVLRPPLPLIHNPSEKLLPHCDGIKLFIGGAGGRIPEGFLNVDFLEVEGVEVVADIQHMPFVTGSVAAIDCDAVLEHVADAQAAVAELHRVLRPGGFLHVVVPFCQAYHAYPSDYRRWTVQGLERLLSDFEILDTGVRAGPTATLLSFFLEYLKLPFRGPFEGGLRRGRLAFLAAALSGSLAKSATASTRAGARDLPAGQKNG